MRSRAVLPTSLLLLCAACAPTSTPTSASSSSPARTTRADPVEPAAKPTAPKPTAPKPSKDPFAAAFVEAHNRARASVSPRADPALPPVQWSEELAASARAWARRCEFGHGESDYGENLAARTDQAEPAAIVASWADEAQHFDHRRNRCASGEVCGHYTQVVWRGSTTIGCGVARCSGGGPFGGGEWFMWVCNYAPPGNWKGEAPY
jgi:pathogenesis-related protein 1